jgi:RNA polymerase sigma factor (sigma-70 family)
MLAIPDFTPEQFHQFLLWLHPDSDQAAQKHETIRGGLYRFFARRNYYDPDYLVDVTLSRVIAKIETIELHENVTQVGYIRGFAEHIYREALRHNKEDQLDPIADQNKFSQPESPDYSVQEQETSCLHECLAKLKPEDRELLQKYYAPNRDRRELSRQRMAEEMGLTIDNLRVKVMRRREKLRTCLSGCKKNI